MKAEKTGGSRQVQQQQPPPASPARAEAEMKWPFFAPLQQPAQQPPKFWDKKNIKTIIPNKEELRYQALLYRIGKKKKTSKGYFFKLSKDGVLSYYKKESDKTAKGYLALSMEISAHLIEQKNKKETLLVIQLERYIGLHITLFDSKAASTMDLFDRLKDFCIVSGFDRLYIQMEVLGKGSFASVYKLKSQFSDNLFAAKTYFRDTFEQSQHKNKFVYKAQKILALLMIQNEIMVLRKVIHPGIIRLYEVIQEKDRLMLVMEFVQGGDLYQLIKEKKKIPEKEAAFMLKGVCEALNEMHIHHYVHRDLKLENIMLKQKDSYVIKLVDFGFAEPINDKELVSKAGTPGYIPPEIFKLYPYIDKGDVFSVGVIFYSLISGISCFKGKNYQAVLDDNRKCEINFERSVWTEITKECKHTLKKMLEKKPSHRYTCADVLEDDWVLLHTDADFAKQQVEEELQRANSHMTNRKSLYNSDASNDDFENDFSYHTNDLKSFYNRASQRTLKTQKSIMSVKSNNKMKQMRQSRSANAKQQDFGLSKSQTLKNRGKSINAQTSGGEEQKSVRFNDKKVNNSDDDGSFGGKEGIKYNYQVDSVLTSKSMKMFDDFQALSTYNSLYLKQSSNLFNQQKKPDLDAKVNDAIKKKKLQTMNALKQ